jgi:hypothetical protein
MFNQGSRQHVLSHPTGVPRSQEAATPWNPTTDLCLGPRDGPKGMAVSYERGTPVGGNAVGPGASLRRWPPTGVPHS